ncbi:MAG: hypothetical protein J4432_01180 [DPANN group archaeon]|nr:hypothetical protein [DPANN group archaeon]
MRKQWLNNASLVILALAAASLIVASMSLGFSQTSPPAASYIVGLEKTGSGLVIPGVAVAEASVTPRALQGYNAQVLSTAGDVLYEQRFSVPTIQIGESFETGGDIENVDEWQTALVLPFFENGDRIVITDFDDKTTEVSVAHLQNYLQERQQYRPCLV